ncbi:MAG TPA: LytS/YhcK type 5TM receptor domain-containing protein, partial [Aquabacterium sp.]|nr:LytS/YhcK type 5TM receptor domain-containing protein [Aquabacterium sp.]
MSAMPDLYTGLIDLGSHTLAVFLVYLLVEANVWQLPHWRSRRWLLTLIFALLTILSLLKGVQLGPGIRIDARYGVLVVATLTLGPVGGAVVGGVAAMMRLWAGGMGAVPGVTVLVLLWGLTLVVMRRHRLLGDDDRVQFRSWRAATESALVGACAPVVALTWIDLRHGHHFSVEVYAAIALTQFLVALVLWFAIQLTMTRTQALLDLQSSNQALASSFRHTVGALAS